jgi:hypothetical protein
LSASEHTVSAFEKETQGQAQSKVVSKLGSTDFSIEIVVKLDKTGKYCRGNKIQKQKTKQAIRENWNWLMQRIQNKTDKRQLSKDIDDVLGLQEIENRQNTNEGINRGQCELDFGGHHHQLQ